MLFSVTIIVNINKQGKTMMKRLLFSATAAVIAMGTFATAAEVQASYPADGPNSYDVLHGANSNLVYSNKVYIGLGYSYMSIDAELFHSREKYDFDFSGNAITLLGGYSFNQYFAVEGRYSSTLGDLSFDASYGGYNDGVGFAGDMQNAALYLKPKYSTPDVSIYGLLGFGQFQMNIDGFNDDLSESAFQWGLGMSFKGGEHLNIFVDYIRLYSDSENPLLVDYSADLAVDTFNIGLAYKF